MEKPCCIGVVRDAKDLQGIDCACGGAPAYLATPGDSIARKIGVLVLHDIWGFNIPNAKYIADHFASNGFHAVLPNLYHGISTLDGWSGTEFNDGEPLEGTRWDTWWTEITSDAYWNPFHERVAAAARLLRDECGCTALCAIGFCNCAGCKPPTPCH